VRLPDGTPGTIEVQATSASSVEVDGPAGELLSLEGVRQLRRLLVARVSGGEGSGT
jgi:hypothetical protein